MPRGHGFDYGVADTVGRVETPEQFRARIEKHARSLNASRAEQQRLAAAPTAAEQAAMRQAQVEYVEAHRLDNFSPEDLAKYASPMPTPPLIPKFMFEKPSRQAFMADKSMNFTQAKEAFSKAEAAYEAAERDHNAAAAAALTSYEAELADWNSIQHRVANAASNAATEFNRRRLAQFAPPTAASQPSTKGLAYSTPELANSSDPDLQGISGRALADITKARELRAKAAAAKAAYDAIIAEKHDRTVKHKVWPTYIPASLPAPTAASPEAQSAPLLAPTAAAAQAAQSAPPAPTAAAVTPVAAQSAPNPPSSSRVFYGDLLAEDEGFPPWADAAAADDLPQVFKPASRPAPTAAAAKAQSAPLPAPTAASPEAQPAPLPAPTAASPEAQSAPLPAPTAASPEAQSAPLLPSIVEAFQSFFTGAPLPAPTAASPEAQFAPLPAPLPAAASLGGACNAPPYVPPPAFSMDPSSFFDSKKKKDEFFAEERKKDRNPTYAPQKAAARVEHLNKCIPIVASFFAQGMYPSLAILPIGVILSTAGIVPQLEWSPGMCEMLHEQPGHIILMARLAHLEAYIRENGCYPAGLQASSSYAAMIAEQNLVLRHKTANAAGAAMILGSQLRTTAAALQQQLNSSAPRLPPGWVQATDPSSGLPYYHNAATGVSTWDLPL